MVRTSRNVARRRRWSLADRSRESAGRRSAVFGHSIGFRLAGAAGMPAAAQGRSRLPQLAAAAPAAARSIGGLYRLLFDRCIDECSPIHALRLLRPPPAASDIMLGRGHTGMMATRPMRRQPFCLPRCSPSQAPIVGAKRTPRCDPATALSFVPLLLPSTPAALSPSPSPRKNPTRLPPRALQPSD